MDHLAQCVRVCPGLEGNKICGQGVYFLTNPCGPLGSSSTPSPPLGTYRS